MKISIFGKRIEIPDWFHKKVEDTLLKTVQKYFDHTVDASVTFGKAPSFYTCDIHVHVSRGLSIRGEGEAHDVQSAFEDAMEHVTRRLSRYKDRLKSRRSRKAYQEHIEEGRQYILNHQLVANDLEQVAEEEKSEQEIQNHIITEKPTDIATLTVYEAIMHLDLSERPVLMFRNAENERINVIYRQNDGQVVWLDSGLPG